MTALPLVHSTRSAVVPAQAEVAQESRGGDWWRGRVSWHGADSDLGAVGRWLGGLSFPGTSGLVS